MYEVACHIITAIKNNVSSYDEADCILREKLFKYYLDCEQFSDAAQILSGINLDSTSRPFTEKEKTDVYVRCAETFLEDDEAIDAEIFVNKASALINTVDDVALLLRYRVTYARVLDANRKFIEASVRYYELSTTTTANVLNDHVISGATASYRPFSPILSDSTGRAVGAARQGCDLRDPGKGWPAAHAGAGSAVPGRASGQSGPAVSVQLPLHGAEQDVPGADPEEGRARRLRGVPVAPPESGTCAC